MAHIISGHLNSSFNCPWSRIKSHSGCIKCMYHLQKALHCMALHDFSLQLTPIMHKNHIQSILNACTRCWHSGMITLSRDLNSSLKILWGTFSGCACLIPFSQRFPCINFLMARGSASGQVSCISYSGIFMHGLQAAVHSGMVTLSRDLNSH